MLKQLKVPKYTVYDELGNTISNKTKAWCKDNFPRFCKELWSSSLPDLHPMDFSVWSMLETETCHSPHTTVESLNVSLVKALAKIRQKKLRAVVETFRRRIERVVAAEGWQIENKLCYCFVRLWNRIWSLQLSFSFISFKKIAFYISWEHFPHPVYAYINLIYFVVFTRILLYKVIFYSYFYLSYFTFKPETHTVYSFRTSIFL